VQTAAGEGVCVGGGALTSSGEVTSELPVRRLGWVGGWGCFGSGGSSYSLGPWRAAAGRHAIARTRCNQGASAPNNTWCHITRKCGSLTEPKHKAAFVPPFSPAICHLPSAPGLLPPLCHRPSAIGFRLSARAPAPGARVPGGWRGASSEPRWAGEGSRIGFSEFSPPPQGGAISPPPPPHRLLLAAFPHFFGIRPFSFHGIPMSVR
jgi:hypothetical protein